MNRDDFMNALKEITIIGGFICYISANERNQFDEYLDNFSEYQEYVILVAQADFEFNSKNGALDTRFIELVKKIGIIKDKLYTIRKAWFEALPKEVSY